MTPSSGTLICSEFTEFGKHSTYIHHCIVKQKDKQSDEELCWVKHDEAHGSSMPFLSTPPFQHIHVFKSLEILHTPSFGNFKKVLLNRHDELTGH